MSQPPNFARAVDLSSLGKPKVESNATIPGAIVTAANLTSKFLALSRTVPVILICWSPRSPESIEMANTLGALEATDDGAWVLGQVDIDAQPQVAQALQTKTVPFGVAIIGEQMVPLFEQNYPSAQVRLVIDKVLALAAEQGVGSTPVEKIEPEEDEALSALEAGNYLLAEAAYKKWLSRKPNDPLAKLGLAQTQLLIRTENLDAFKIQAQISADPQNLILNLQAADLEIGSGNVEAAFTRLLNLIKSLSGDEKTKAKNHLISLFSLVDASDPRLISARSALASALF